jgi:imidazolonepropionase-like amidohydrolase
MKRANIKMGIGTDLIGTLYRHMPAPYIEELKEFVSAGYSLSEALVAATRSGAEILDMQDKIGTLEKGKRADVLIVDGKPDVSLDDLSKVDMVIRDGIIVVRDGSVVVGRHTIVPMPASIAAGSAP